MMILKVTLKGILKLYFTLTISSLMRSLEKFWKSCNKIYIRVETLFAFCSLHLGALSTLRIAAENLKNDFWEVSVLSKCFESLEIEPSVSLYIFYGLQ